MLNQIRSILISKPHLIGREVESAMKLSFSLSDTDSTKTRTVLYSMILSRLCHFLLSRPPPATQPPELLETLVTVDATVMLLTPIRPGGGASSVVSSTSSAPIGQNTQELLISEQWFSALSLSEGPTICAHIAGMEVPRSQIDHIYIVT